VVLLLTVRFARNGLLALAVQGLARLVRRQPEPVPAPTSV
jgi:hypothetical protein